MAMRAVKVQQERRIRKMSLQEMRARKNRAEREREKERTRVSSEFEAKYAPSVLQSPVP